MAFLPPDATRWELLSRRRGLSRGGAAYHALTLQSIVNPSARHLQTVAYEQIEERDDSGDPAPTDRERSIP